MNTQIDIISVVIGNGVASRFVEIRFADYNATM